MTTKNSKIKKILKNPGNSKMNCHILYKFISIQNPHQDKLCIIFLFQKLKHFQIILVAFQVLGPVSVWSQIDWDFVIKIVKAW